MVFGFTFASQQVMFLLGPFGCQSSFVSWCVDVSKRTTRFQCQDEKDYIVKGFCSLSFWFRYCFHVLYHTKMP